MISGLLVPGRRGASPEAERPAERSETGQRDHREDHPEHRVPIQKKMPLTNAHRANATTAMTACRRRAACPSGEPARSFGPPKPGADRSAAPLECRAIPGHTRLTAVRHPAVTQRCRKCDGAGRERHRLRDGGGHDVPDGAAGGVGGAVLGGPRGMVPRRPWGISDVVLTARVTGSPPEAPILTAPPDRSTRQQPFQKRNICRSASIVLRSMRRTRTSTRRTSWHPRSPITCWAACGLGRRHRLRLSGRRHQRPARGLGPRRRRPAVRAGPARGDGRFEAVGYAKFTGRVGVCAATSGPGAIHLLNGLYDAKLDHVPVVAIVGQTNRSAMGGSYQQEVDLLSLFKDVRASTSRWSWFPSSSPMCWTARSGSPSPSARRPPSSSRPTCRSWTTAAGHEFKMVPSSIGVHCAASSPTTRLRPPPRSSTPASKVAILAAQGARGGARS